MEAGERSDVNSFFSIEQVRLLTNILTGMAAGIGIPGNIFVLVAILSFRNMRTVSNIYIFNLALADLIFLLGTPVIVIQSIKKVWVFGRVMCIIFLTANAISQFASAAFIGLLSLDRYLAVCRAVTGSNWRTNRYCITTNWVSQRVPQLHETVCPGLSGINLPMTLL